MSAIAGLWRFDGKPDSAVDCARMMSAQEIYGPHDGRLWSAGPLAMGRRLFRSLPEDVYDRGPLQSADGRFALVADVRLDNRDELQSALGIAGRQQSDAAVLLESLERWGEAALDRLVGDFAFALWNARGQKLLLARDFLGQRPLHYHRGKDFFAFSSMTKGLHALSDVPYAADEQVMAEFVTLLPQAGPSSFFKGIERVEAGHIATVTRDGLSVRRYWEPRRPRAENTSASDYVEGLRHHLDQATRARLRGANGAVGAQMSAGFDSASVAATAARLQAPSSGKVVAFTAVPREGYDGQAPKNRLVDEGPLAAATAALYPNIEHVRIRSGHCSPLDGLDRSFFLFDRPVLNLCNWVWCVAINDAARERRLGIMLTGQFGNMTVSYDGIEWLPELLRTGRLLTLAGKSRELIANRQLRWRGLLAQTFGPFAPAWLWRWVNDTFGEYKRDILAYTAIRADRLAELDIAARARDLDFSYRPRRDGFATRLWVLRRVDIGSSNKGQLAGWGIDYRDPTADKRLVEYCLSVPMEEYLAGGVRRSLAKRALADRLPQAVLNERRKGYQAADWHEGLSAHRGDVAAELDRLVAAAPAANLLDIARLKALVDNWPASGWEQSGTMMAYRLALLRGISAGHFLRKAMRSNE